MKVSVIIPVFNAAPFVEKAVNSALVCPEVKEILLIEDHSEDNSYNTCKRIFKSQNMVKLFRTPCNKNNGASVARNVGIQNASMDHIAFLDADDFYLKNRFIKDKVVFESVDEVDGVYNCLGSYIYSEKALSLFKAAFPDHQSITSIKKNISSGELLPSLLGLRGNTGYFSIDTLTIKRKSLEKLDYWFNENLRLHQDTEFILRLAWHCKLLPGEIKNPVAKRGLHENNRITRIRSNHREHQLTQYKLWSSLFRWAQKHDINKECKQKIQLLYSCKSLNAKPRLTRFPFFLWYLFSTKGLLLLDDGHYKNAHYAVFGKNRVSRILLKLKRYMLQKLGGAVVYPS
jgi:glycosyltransferase involved in cell wall biosynthesis